MKYDKTYQELGKYLKECREEKGVSQKAVSEMLGYTSTQFVSNWERGLSYPPLETMAKLIDFYGLKRNKIIELLSEAKKRKLTEELDDAISSSRAKTVVGAKK